VSTELVALLGSLALLAGACGGGSYDPGESTAALCQDGQDNDGDGASDCDDSDCAGFVFCGSGGEGSAVACQDGQDNDDDGRTDCADADCQGFTFCLLAEGDAAGCQDGEDNDADGQTDCDDPGCQGFVFCVRAEGDALTCQDGQDNDGDGATDCDDPGCALLVACQAAREDSPEACRDLTDNDGDGRIDCLDTDCQGFVFCMPPRENDANLCRNGRDDDGDGSVDCLDPDCQGFVFCVSTTEDTPITCQDLVDNDGDGATDCDDTGCEGLAVCLAPGESSAAECQNLGDDDGDGDADCDDPGCWAWGFCQHYNGYPVVDSWGETWDGIERAPRPWAQAEADCLALGGRLPTATELWRNHASGGSGDLSDTNAQNFLWTRVLNAQPGWAVLVRLGDGTLSAQDMTAAARYRCVWPDSDGAGFDQARCHGDPGAGCHAFERFWSVDSRDRAPLDYAAATNECAFHGASLPASSDWSRLLRGGLPHGTNAWLWVGRAIEWYSGGYGSPLVRWTDGDAAGWFFYQGGAGYASLDTGGASHAFRCIGLRAPADFAPPAPPACNGPCFALDARRSPVVADDADRAPARISAAIADCRDEGADLPTLADATELIHAGWPNGTGMWLWLVEPEYWYADGYGQPIFQWTGAGSPHWIYDGSRGAVSWGYDARPYRCVWHAQGPDVPACQAGEVAVWRDGAYACQAAVAGSSNGQAYVIEIVDDWGNAWDGIQRDVLGYPEASALCAGLGGRLPTASELFAVRATGNPHDPIGDINATSYLWTSSPVTQAGERALVRVSDGGASHAPEATPQYVRCVWPSTRGDVLANRNCYGPPGDECFRSPDGLSLDSYDRPAVDVVTAGHECAAVGGHLAAHHELAELVHAGAPNGSDAYLWLDDFAYWYSGNYGYHLGRWSGVGLPDWEYDQGVHGGVGYGSDYRPFRCVHDRALR